MDAVLDYLMERWPVLALFVVVIIITAVVVWLLSRWYHRFEKVENTIKELPCSKHDKLYNDIREELIAIRTYLTVKDTDVENVFSKNTVQENLMKQEKNYMQMLMARIF